jgi:hypothetical protein
MVEAHQWKWYWMGEERSVTVKRRVWWVALKRVFVG